MELVPLAAFFQTKAETAASEALRERNGQVVRGPGLIFQPA
jgi:hypothetical protein